AEESCNRYGGCKSEQAERRQFAAALPPSQNAIGDQPKKETCGESRHCHIGFGLLEVMNEREQSDRIDRLMQTPPAPAAEPAHHAVGRGRRKRRKSDPSHRADDQIEAMRDLVNEFSDTVTLVGEKQCEVHSDITERADAEHPAHIDEIGVAKDAAERR